MPDIHEAYRQLVEPLGLIYSPELSEPLEHHCREKVVTGGWRGGKSVEAFLEAYLSEALWRKGGLIWIIGPTYQGAHTETNYLHAALFGEGLIKGEAKMPEDGPRHIETVMGSVIETRTSQHPERLASDAPDLLIVVEAGQQPESVREAVLGRAMQKDAPIVYSGTLEAETDGDFKPRYAWFNDLAGKWATERTREHAAFALPSWANRQEFPGGEYDPKIERLRRELDGHAFDRRVRGIPSGVQYPVYSRLGVRGLYDLPSVSEGRGLWLWGLGAGGHDFGEGYGHFSTLAAVTVNTLNEAWVREVRRNNSGDTDWIEKNRRELSSKYHIGLSRWGFDPMQREAARRSGADVIISEERLRRAGLIEARLIGMKMFWDMSGPGVGDAFEQMKRAHLVKRESSKGIVFAYARVDDDDVAAVENAIRVIDGKPPPPPRGARVKAPKRPEKVGWSGV